MRIVIALGGNALGNSFDEQQKLIRKACLELLPVIKDNEVIITHGNGPQVGMITKALANDSVLMPLDCCTAMSEGYIGYHIQKILRDVLKENGVNKETITLVTEVLVDQNDPSFNNPTKPIGKFYTEDEAKRLMQDTNDLYVNDANRGFRKVVASPKPIDIYNVSAVNALLDENMVVISCGGGGIPVINDSSINKVDAVIDKDLASSLLAEKINADMLVILTAVDQVKINFGKENEQGIDYLSIFDIDKYIQNDEFKKGSMLPKIEACRDFVEKTCKTAIITSLDNAKGIITRNGVTVIGK